MFAESCYASRVALSIFTTRVVERSGDVIGKLDDNRSARLPACERISKDDLGTKLAVFVLGHANGDVMVSRRSPQLIAELLRDRYPEIARGDLDVYAVVREPGVRAKVGLDWGAGDDDLIERIFAADDGVKLKAIVSASGDPLIDLVPTSPEPAVYVAAAMAPNELLRVLIDEDAHRLVLVVPDHEVVDPVHTQLAADLIGWHLSVLREGDHRARGWNVTPISIASCRSA